MATVAIGLSGGVDSSVAAYLLTKRFSQLLGVSHDICENSLTCNEQTLSRAAALASRLGFEYVRFDLKGRFEELVMQDFIQEYQRGRTPNPCARCNERVRFGEFFTLCEEYARSHGYPEPLYFATGHYARIDRFEGQHVIAKGKDSSKDQSYMLYRISPQLLPRIIFPLGEHSKKEIVQIAIEQGFPSSSVKESQDICFIPGRYTDFLQERLTSQKVDRPGPILDTEGKVLGEHRGYMHYTIGQRQGLGLGNGPWYVTSIEAGTNTVRVGRAHQLGTKSFSIEQTNWAIPAQRVAELSREGRVKVKIRYNSPERQARLCIEEGYTVDLDEPSSITPGQSAVFYHDEYVLGGGIIS